MNRSAYLNDSHVRAFIKWITPFVTGERGLAHRGYDFLFEAYQEYDWRDPGRLCRLRAAVASDDNKLFLDAAIEIRKWGGIHKHVRLRSLGSRALQTFKSNARRLDPRHADMHSLGGIDYVESGYSKIYPRQRSCSTIASFGRWPASPSSALMFDMG